jgi:hypothetical protein
MTNEEMKTRMRMRALKVRCDFAQMVIDIESWNANRTDAPPFDSGAERVLVELCDQFIAAIDRDDVLEWNRLSEEICVQSELACV